MKGRFFKRFSVIGALSALAGMATAFPLWLDAPARLNPFDPKAGAIAIPTNTAVPPTGTLTITTTHTPSPTVTQTITPSPPFSATNTPTVTPSNTPSATPSASPSYTDSPTETPYFSPTETPTATPTTTPCSQGMASDMYEDFEGGTAAYADFFPWAYAGFWAGCIAGEYSEETTVDNTVPMHADGGTNAWKINVINDPSQGCYGGANDDGQVGLYANDTDGGGGGPYGPYDFGCATKFTFWYRSDLQFDMVIHLVEATICAAPNDAEDYTTTLSSPGDSTWRKAVIPLSSFVLNTGFCNGVLDPNSISFPWFVWTNTISNGNIWFDNFRFEP